MIESIANNTKKSVLALLILSVVFFLGLGQVHLFDWDEINFAESAREMIASGDYLHVQINYTAFWEKPPFFFWLQVVSMKMFGINEYAARFPNAVFGFIYLLTFYFIGKRHYSGKFGLIWALLFFGSLLPHIYFKSGIIDPVFNYFIFLSIYFMMRVIGKDEMSGRLALIAGVFSGLSVLTKGPVGFLLLGATLFIYLLIKRFKPFPKLKYILLFFAGLLLVVLSWLSIELIQNGPETMKKFIAYQLELFSSDVAGHAQPFYYHFVVVLLGCFPISFLALPSFRRRETTPFDLQTWMLCLFWVVMIIFSITTTKIIHYSSMTYAPLSFLAALTIYNYSMKGGKLPRWLSVSYLIHGLIVGSLLIGLPILIKNKEWLMSIMNDEFAKDSMSVATGWTGIEVIAGVFFVIAVIVSFVLIRRGKLLEGITSNAIGLSLSLLLVLFMILPKIESFTQGPAIEFYKSKQGEDCYIETFGLKSYAQYYYSETPAGLREESKDMTWLLIGEIDKPVYMVSQSTRKDLDDNPEFQLLYTKGGFRFYKRMPNTSLSPQ